MTNKDKCQEIFTKAYLGLASQNFQKSLLRGTGDICAYRGLNGKRCAIGHCIPDDKYDSILEGLGARSEKILKIIWPDADTVAKKFLLDLQRAHDCYLDPETIKKQLECLAENYNLQVPEIPK